VKTSTRITFLKHLQVKKLWPSAWPILGHVTWTERTPKDPESPNEDPSRLVVSLLEKGEVPWAIVTNGKVWRLYTAKTHSKASNYYEIDLEEVLVHSGQTDAYADFFKYFWLFFRRQAIESAPTGMEGEIKEVTFLDRLLKESKQYAKELGERLKDQIFERIFPHLAGGFIANIREREGKDAEFSPERLDRIFQGTLTLLYRLLFLLYAESRDLLPVREIRGYHEVSLTRIKSEIAKATGTLQDEAPGGLKKVYSKSKYTLHERLNRLFEVIDAGDSNLNVPVYNGGLFLNKVHPEDQSSEAQNTRFLNAHQVPDQYLALALNLLTRDIDPKSEALVSIDFKSLGVRQLGSIYEGLLEFKVRVAPERMAVVKGKKTEEIIPYKQAEKDNRRILTVGRGRNAQERTYPKGAVYLENDKHERKATGSYYTPDHIVKYIIENAVGPVLAEKFEQTMRPKLREAQQAYREAIKRQEAFEKQKMKGDDPEKVAHTYHHVVDELFNIKVLDPAMGSGNFLVEAVDFITDKAIHFLNAFPWNPVTAYLEDIRRTILNEMDQQGVSIDPARLTDINLLKRHILKRCIYGVDLNPMAVELAKVSLWLNCFTLGAPLSFLDHHMKCGNSLIGAKVDEARTAIETGQALLFGGSHFTGIMLATQLMRHVGELSDVTSAQIQESRKEYVEVLDKLKPSKRILDVYTSQWFSNPIRKVGKGKDKKAVSDALDFLKSQDCQDWIENKLETKKLDKESKAIVQRAEADADEKCFFHWELEFPEVFYGPKSGTTQAIERRKNGGFNAVVGNPPWGAEIPTQDKNLIRYQFEGSHKGSIDTFAVFAELSTRLAVKNGFLGLLLPDILLLKNYPSIRLFLLEQTALIELTHWGQAFDQANIDVCSVVARHGTPTEGHRIRCIPGVIEDEIPPSPLNLIEQTVFITNKQYRFNFSLSVQLQGLLEVARSMGPPLGKLCRLREGVHSGNVRANLFLDHPIGDTCEPLIFGRDEISPMQIAWAGKYVQLDSSVFNREAGEYFNLGDPKLHKSQKIIVRRTGDYVLAAIDDKGYFCSNNFFLCIPFSEISWKTAIYICAVLNSRFATWFFRSIQPRTGRLFAELKITHLEDIPIPFWDQPWAEQVGANFLRLFQAEPSKDAITKVIKQFNSDLDIKIRGIRPELSDEIWRRK